MSWSWKHTAGGIGLFAERFLGGTVEVPWEALEDVTGGERDRQCLRWTRLAHDEYRSMVAFAGLLQELTEIAAPLDVIACAARVVRDETRHVELCSRVARELGGPDERAGEPRWVRGDPQRAARDRVALTMVASLCVGETLSVASLGASRDGMMNPACRAVMTLLLADESFHSRFGFLWLEASWRELPYSTRLYVEGSLPAVFARIEADTPQDRRELVLRTLHDEILPRLEEAGIAARKAWEGRRS